MDEKLKKRIQERMEIAADLAAKKRIDDFLKDFQLVDEEDEYGSIGFLSFKSGNTLSPFYLMPGTGESYEDFRVRVQEELAHAGEMRNVAQFVKDWSRLDRNERLNIVRDNMTSFDKDRTYWLTAMTDQECAQLKKAKVEDIYLCVCGIQNIDGVRGLQAAKSDLMQKYGIDTPSANRTPERSSSTMKMAA